MPPDLKAVFIYGSNDGYPEKIEAGINDLPPGAVHVRTEGGNHTQFAYYDTSPDPQQPHDNPADITREEQQLRIIDATVSFLRDLQLPVTAIRTPATA